MTFRSVDMAYYRMVFPRENFYQSVEQIVKLGNAHLVDIGSPLHRPFFAQVKRCDELLVKVGAFITEVKGKGLHFQEYNELEEGYIEGLDKLWKKQAKKIGVQSSKLLDYFENEINEQWNRFHEKRNSIDKLVNGQKQMLGKIACYQAIQHYFGAGINREAFGDGKALATIVGVIPPELQLKLSKTIYRVSRGYASFKTFDTFQFRGLKKFTDKVVVLIYPNSEAGILKKKLSKVMETFCTNILQSEEVGIVEAKRLQNEFDQSQGLLKMNEGQLKKWLQLICEKQYIEKWRTYLWKERLIYENLNKMQVREHFLIAEVYFPKNQVQRISLQISRLAPTPSLQELPSLKPPTAFNTNTYTKIAQEITDTYGVPRYQEMNPAIFTTITFPFFFGVMFGDMGHGLILLIVGLCLVLKGGKAAGVLGTFLELRYMVLLMGFFAFYCGWIYNDFLGMNVNLLGSCFDVPPAVEANDGLPTTELRFSPQKNCIYPFGIDPVWGRATNELVYVNSLKMKISVIIAIVHMTVGVIIKLANSLYFRKKLDVWFEFIPQVIFLGLLFGYMDFLIIFKWLKGWDCIGTNKSCYAPSIISTMMNIGLKVGKTDPNANMWGLSQNTSQDGIQVVILLISVICIPWMLLPKPIIEIKHKNRTKVKENPLLLVDQLEDEKRKKQKGINDSEQSDPLLGLAKKDNEDFNAVAELGHQEGMDSSEIFVHQLIETIEFVLGAISNTASYLRLWALSLAHSQLAKVFFNKTLQSGYTSSPIASIIMMPLMFYILVWVTFGVLMCMDTMECFLHSLRLHWVEFQNKFYKGDGYKYEPIDCKSYIIEMKQKEE